MQGMENLEPGEVVAVIRLLYGMALQIDIGRGQVNVQACRRRVSVLEQLAPLS